MPEPDAVAIVAGNWLAKAEADLDAARHVLATRGAEPWVATFHAQQAAEKYLKAALVAEQIAFPRTHELELLGRLLPTVWPRPATDVLASLTRYAVAGRYPQGFFESGPDPDWGEAEEAVRDAEAVAAAVLSGMGQRGIHP